MLYVCWWFMAFLLRPGLNCLTSMLVSASLWWMDGCQHASVTLFTFMRSAFVLTASHQFHHSRYSNGFSFWVSSVMLLSVCRLPFSSVWVFLVSPPRVPMFFRASPYFLDFTPVAFFSNVTAVNCLSKQHVVGEETKKQLGEKKKVHWQKLFIPGLDCIWKKRKKNRLYLRDWVMLAQLRGCCFCWDEWCCSA